MSENGDGITVIVPVYNGEKTLGDTLRSVARMEHGPVEVLVVDDGSTDGTAAEAESCGARVIRLPENRGPAAARNLGAMNARHDLLLFTDSDVWVPKRLPALVLESLRDGRAAAVQGVFSDVCPYANFFSQYKNLYNRFVLTELPEWIDTTFTSVTAVRRSAFLACGGFDGNIRGASVEDRTLGRNLIRNGYKIRLDRRIEVVHNKKLSLWGFLRNQYCRSRDLAKLLLRNRAEGGGGEPEPPAGDESGRFGTNSAATMGRIPIAYLTVLFSGLSAVAPVFLFVVAFLALFFIYLTAPFQWYLFRRRGMAFCLKGLAANFADALVSGAGVLAGMADYWLMGRKY